MPKHFLMYIKKLEKMASQKREQHMRPAIAHGQSSQAPDSPLLWQKNNRKTLLKHENNRLPVPAPRRTLCPMKTAPIATAACLSALVCLAVPTLPAKGELAPPAELAKPTPQTSSGFAAQFYSQLSKEDGNLFFSPASIEAALAMVREGANGKTLEQFNQLLPKDCASTVTATNVILESANAIWADQKFPILGHFKTAVTENYAADVRTADFQTKPDAERRVINQWVEEKTRNKIKDLLPAGSVSATTRMVLVNAVYFKGDWLCAFKPERTAEAPFWISADESVSVPMMRLNGEHFSYGETEFFKTLELPYEGDEVSMLLILPTSKDGLDKLSVDFETCFDGMRRAEINVSLPRFKIESSFPSMKQTLAALGLTDAFSEQADFSGISTEPLFISDVVHKAFVEVNEKGTEAAAATGVIVRATAFTPPKVFRADHPFLFLIRENESGKILFMGRVSNPSATDEP